MPKIKLAAKTGTNRVNNVSNNRKKERQELRKSDIKRRAKPGSVALREVKMY